MPAEYRYQCWDLRTKTRLGELPFQASSLPRVLGNPSSTTLSLPLGDPAIAAQNPMVCTQPGRTLITVDRDNVLVWSGIVWKRTRSHQGDGCDLSVEVATPESYLSHRFITADASVAGDRLTIARSLITTMQAAHGGNIGITVDATISGVTDLGTWAAADLTTILEALKTWAEVDVGGFDWTIDTAYVSGLPQFFFRTGFPRLGQITAVSDVVFRMPGNLMSYTLDESADDAATALWAVGQPQGVVLNLISVVYDNPSVDAGYPVIEQRKDYPRIGTQPLLDSHARADLGAVLVPVITSSWAVQADSHPVVGSYRLGDDAKFEITDDGFPEGADGPGLSVTQRVTGIDLIPGPPEVVNLTTDRSSTSRIPATRATLSAQLRAMRTALVAMRRALTPM